MSTSIDHIAIFTSNLDFNIRWHCGVMAEEFPHARIAILIHAPKKKLSKVVRNQFRNFSRHGWRWLPYQCGEVVSLVLGRLKKPYACSDDLPGSIFTRDALMKHPRIQVRRFENINSEEACAFLASLSADIGLSLGAPILKPELFSLPRLGTLNLHKGQLPHYRGMPPAFWELMNGEREVGCTIHQVNAGLDTGDILLETTVPVDEFSTVAGMQTKLHHCGVNMICEAIRMIQAGTIRLKKQPSGGTVHKRPPLALEKQLSQRLKNKKAADSDLKGALKKAFFLSYAHVYAPIINWWRGLMNRQRVVILLYHRVSDRFRDHVTVGIEQFDEHMAYIARNFPVVSLKEIAEGKIRRNGSKPIVAVSFDDGYLDNFENAAPILLKHGVPCTFFISTEKITHNKPFDHDIKLLGTGLDNMSWTDVEKMKKWGFHFGSHTRNHVNLAEVSDDVALFELKESLQDIRDKLDQDQVLIAFPYGRKRHITDARIAMIKEVGYAACFSAYGGFNDADIDQFDIRRTGINWAFDLSALKSRLNGWDKNLE